MRSTKARVEEGFRVEDTTDAPSGEGRRAIRLERGRRRDFSKESRDAHVAQVVEHVLGKDEVSGSSPLVSSRQSVSRDPKFGDAAGIGADGRIRRRSTTRAKKRRDTFKSIDIQWSAT